MGDDPPSFVGAPARAVLGLLLWAALVLVAWRVGLAHRAPWRLKAAPLFGDVDPVLPPVALFALVVGLAAAWRLPRWAERAAWRTLVAVTPALALGWGALLASARPDGLRRGLDGPFEYPAVLPAIDAVGVGRFVATFADERVLAGYPIHVQGHPVGAPLAFWALDALGLRGAGAAGLACAVIGASTWAAVLLAVREVAGERLARALAPFLVLVPAAVWMVASADAAFAAVAAWATALLVLASRPQRSARSVAALAVGSGVLWGVGILLTYGLVPVALVGVAVVVARRRWDVLGWAAVGGAMVLAIAGVAGFWWWDGLAATQVRYHDGVAALRPRLPFTVLMNPAALALALGPAIAVALAVVRDRRLWLLAGAAWLALLVANASGLSKGEVERIWLPFVPWALVLAAGLPTALPARPHRTIPALLSAQVLVALGVELLVRTPW